LIFEKLKYYYTVINNMKHISDCIKRILKQELFNTEAGRVVKEEIYRMLQEESERMLEREEVVRMTWQKRYYLLTKRQPGDYVPLPSLPYSLSLLYKKEELGGAFPATFLSVIIPEKRWDEIRPDTQIFLGEKYPLEMFS